MQTYTYTHVVQVFIFGIFYGCFLAGIVMVFARIYRQKKNSQVKEPVMAEVIPLKRKIPSVKATEYQMIYKY